MAENLTDSELLSADVEDKLQLVETDGTGIITDNGEVEKLETETGNVAVAIRSDVAVSKCPICWDNLDNPKMLPCLHAFCLKCIGRYCRHTQSDSLEGCTPTCDTMMTCPVCRNPFLISDEGVVSLPDDPFLQRLAEDEKMSAKATSGEPPCEVCHQEQSKTGAAVPSATMYCMDCCQRLCEGCSVPHKRWKGGAHDIRNLDKELGAQLSGIRGSFCANPKHKNERLKLYCTDCNANICMMCFAVEHNGHQCEEIASAAEHFEAVIAEKLHLVEMHASGTERMAGQLDSEMERFVEQTREIENEIRQIGDEMKRRIDVQVNEYLTELDGRRSEALKSVASAQEALRLSLAAMRSFDTYSKELMMKGTPSDVTRVGGDLNLRADELLQMFVRPGNYHTPFIYFDAAQTLETFNAKFGEVRSAEFSVAEIISAGDDSRIAGIAMLAGSLYVARDRPVEQIEVYDVYTGELQDCLSVPDLYQDSIRGIAACPVLRRIYISDSVMNCVHRVKIGRGPMTTTQWSVYDQPHGLSVTASQTVLVTCPIVHKLKEFAAKRHSPLRVIDLEPDLRNPCHSIQLSYADALRYVICHGGYGDAVHRICIVGADGKIERSYGGPPGSAAGLLHTPIGLAVDSSGGQIFAADAFNGRVLVASPTFGGARELIARDFARQWYPCGLCLDETTRCLYVAENEIRGGHLVACHVIAIQIG